MSTSGQVAARYFLGTHRIRTPEETWHWLAPALAVARVTRVADVTGLDRLGIPVYQAVRPASKNLCVSQGKAVTAMAAKVSAAMEAVELWHAEDLSHLPQAEASLREMDYGNPIPNRDLKWRADTRLLDALPIPWLKARSLTRDRDGWLPRAMLELDLSLPRELRPQMFHRTSNGLASGNCREEALIHALAELVERHALFLAHAAPERKVALDERSFAGTFCAEPIRRMREAGMKLALWDLTWEAGLPCVVADLVADDLPNVWRGSGCHLSPEVAASRALSEAAQSRLTYIAGARDDLTEFSTHLPAASRFDGFALPAPERQLDEMPSLATGDLARDLALMLERLDRLGFEPFAVDCTREEIGVPVASVYVPGLKEAPYG